MLIVLSYDLNGHERPSSYSAVKSMIEQNSISYTKALYSQWFVQTNDEIAVWDSRMKQVTDETDRWFIDIITPARAGWLNKAVWVWLNSRT